MFKYKLILAMALVASISCTGMNVTSAAANTFYYVGNTSTMNDTTKEKTFLMGGGDNTPSLSNDCLMHKSFQFQFDVDLTSLNKSNSNYTVADYDLKVCMSVAAGAFPANATDVWVSTPLAAFNTTAGTQPPGSNVSYKWPVTAGDQFALPKITNVLNYFKATGFKTNFKSVGNASASPSVWCVDDSQLQEMFTTGRDQAKQTNESSTFAVSFTWDQGVKCWNKTANATNDGEQAEVVFAATATFELSEASASSTNSKTWIYILVGAVALVLIIVGVVCCLRAGKEEIEEHLTGEEHHDEETGHYEKD